MNYQEILDAYKKCGTKAGAARLLKMPVSTFKDYLRRAQAGEATRKVTPPPMKQEEINIVYFTDAHNSPDLPKDRFNWLAKYINDKAPHYLIDGGDFDDLQSLCRHERNETWSGKFKPAFLDDLAASNEARQILHEGIKVPCVKHVTLGNHESRLWDFEDNNPEIYGMMQHEYLAILEKYGWNVTPYREYLTIAGIDFTHIPMNGMNKPVGGKNPCVGISRDSIKDICFGHTHALGLVVNHKLGKNRSVVAFNGGSFMPDGYMPSYANNSQKEFWYGAHHLQSIGGRLHVRESITMKELEKRYG